MRSWIGGAAALTALFGGSVGLLVATGSKDSGNRPDAATGVEVAAHDAVVVTTLPHPRSGSTPPPPRPEVPKCTNDDKRAEGDPLADWDTIVVDTGHQLDTAFVPPDLVPVSQAGFYDNGDTIRSIVVADLGALRAAAEAHGTPIMIVSAFRGAAYQRNLFEGRVVTSGPEEAAAYTARPGHSEHQLGTAIDVLDPRGQELNANFGLTTTGVWVEAHAHEFGFVLSYPEGARDTTCYDYEPWHLRYVGRDIAGRIHRSGMSPREWLLSQAMAAG